MIQARVAFALAFSFIFLAAFAESAFAQQANGPVIFDVRRSLPLEPDEPVTKDFYINAGPETGMKKGVYVSVVRAVPVHDPIKNVQQATLRVPVGKLKVVDVQRGITIARLETELTDDDRPTLEFEGVMIGDYVDLGSITTDEPKKPKPRKRVTATHTTSNEQESEPASSLAAGLAAISAAPEIAKSAPEAPAAPVPPAAATTSAASLTPAPTGAPTPLTTNAVVEPETSTTARDPSARNNSANPQTQPGETPKKSTSPKSVELNPLENPSRSRARTDSVRVADYSDAGF